MLTGVRGVGKTTTARLIARGVPPRLACQTAIAEPLTDEPDALAALTQVVEISI